MSIAVSQKAIYIVTSDKQVLRWLVSETEQVKESRKEGVNELIIRGGNTAQQRPEKVFCDQSGWHSLVTFNTEDTHYFHLTANQSLLVSKVHGLSITSVGWNRNTERYNTKEILLGSNKGSILELVVEYDAATETIKHTVNRLFEVANQIYGIEYIVFAGLPCKISVIVACTNHLYQFVGDPNEQGRPGFVEIFAKYKTNVAKFQSSVLEVSGNLSKSQLQLYYYESMPDCFSWMNGVGMFFSNLPASSSEKLYVEHMTPLQNPKGIENVVAIGITKHHLYFLNQSALYIISKITQQVVHTIEFEKRQGYELVGMVFHQQSHSFFVWSFRFIYQIVVEQEEKDVWKHYIERNMYEDAIRFCEQIQSPAYPKVKGMYADYLFASGRSIEAAEAYVRSEKSFEEITLKLMSNREALQRYIEAKLKLLPSEMRSQRTLLATWLLEIYLDNINEKCMTNDEDAVYSEHKLQQFLVDLQDDLDEETTCDILQSHGMIEDWVFFADLRKKYEMVILHHINQYEFKKALNRLDQVDPNGKENLLCKYAPIFMKSEPKRVVDILIGIAKHKKGQVDFKKIIPALMNVDNSSRDQAINLESFLIKDLKIKDKSINNLYIFHLSELEGEKQLIEYLKLQEREPELAFDPDYALSVFKRNGKIESQIYLYSLLKMHTEAVALALENKKIELAKQNAKKPRDTDEELSRRLWLQIAIHHIKSSNVREALIVMNESRLIKMEDLLPYFDEQDSISNFKDDICKTLAAYKQKIEELNGELNESKNSSEQVKKELKTIKERYIEIEGMQPCEICSRAVMKTAFYVYPCSHAYHRECLLELIMPQLRKKDSIRYSKISAALEEIAEKEGRLPVKKNSKPVEESKLSIRELYRKLNQLLAPQCYFCSGSFIETVKDDIIDEDDVEARLWMIEGN